MGVSVARIAIPLVAVSALKMGALEVGLVSTFLTLPSLLIGLPAGFWVDRASRRSVLVACQLARALILLTIPAAWWLGVLTVWQLFAAVLLFGSCNVFYDVAYQSFLPQLVARDNLLAANARLTSVSQISLVCGPAVGGQLIALCTAPFSFLITGVGLVFSSIFVMRIRSPFEAPARPPRTRMLGEVASGMRIVRQNNRLLALALSSGWQNLTSYAAYAVTVLFLARNLGLSAGLIGIYYSIVGLGGVAAAFVARAMSIRIGHGRAMWILLLLGSPFSLVLPLVRPGWSVWAAACANAVVAFASVAFSISQVSSCQAMTPDAYLGKVNATMRFVTWSVMPVAALIGGALGSWIGPRDTLFVTCGAGCLAFLPVFLSPWRRMREMPSLMDLPKPARAGAA